jgi:aspartyl-tRNA synthetase
VEATNADRPIPLVSFVARQRDLRDLVGENLAGSVQVQFSDVLKHWEARFHRITLEDRNLPAIAERRVLRPINEAARQTLQGPYDDVMKMQEELLVAALSAVKEKHGDAIKELFDVDVTVPALPFPRIPLAEAKRIVAERGYEVPRDDEDMDPEGERQIAAYVAEEMGHEFVFLTDYAANIRPFYHMRHDDNPALTKSYDLIWNGTEITTGAQREHRIEVLEAQAREKGLDPEGLGFYLDFFRYGVPPHGGFGMGLSRMLMLLLHQPNLREVSFLFRGPNRLTP